MATLQSGKCFTVPTFFGMCCRSEWQERMYIYKWHEVDQTKHEIFCVHIVCNEIQVKVNLEITTFFFYLRFPYCPNFFWFGVVNGWTSRTAHFHEGIHAARPRQHPRQWGPYDTVPARDHVPPADGAPRHLQPGESPIPIRNPAVRREISATVRGSLKPAVPVHPSPPTVPVASPPAAAYSSPEHAPVPVPRKRCAVPAHLERPPVPAPRQRPPVPAPQSAPKSPRHQSALQCPFLQWDCRIEPLLS